MASDDTSVRFGSDARADDAHPSQPTADSALGALDSAPRTTSHPAASETIPSPVDDKTVISKAPPIASEAVRQALPRLLGTTLVGKRLEHYELDQFVGGGGMGAVFRATDTRLGRVVAVKVLSRDQSDEETIRRFKNEAQSAARLDHPNIARVYYVGEDRGWNFIVFEFIEGTNLRDEVDRGGPLDLETALRYTLQVAQALAHSSSRDVVHRDIKPSNVLVTANGQVKLVDMGLARLHQVESSAEDLTASGVTLGTFDYISPEQARDPRAADVRSDIYSLGCTLFFMLTGQPPFPDGTALQKLLRHNSDEPPDVRVFRPELNPRVSDLLAKMLSKRPSHRQQSADEVITDIIALGQQLGLASIEEMSHIVVGPATPASQWWNKAWQILGAIALLVAAIAGFDAVVSPRPAGGDVVLTTRFKSASESPAELRTTQSESDRPLPENQRSLANPGTGIPDASAGEGGGDLSNRTQRALSISSAPESTTDSAIPSHPHLPADEAIRSSERAAANSQGTNAQTTTGQSLTNGQSPLVSAPGVTPAGEDKVKRIVVLSGSSAPPDPRTEYVPTLSEACSRAAELGLTEIELHYSGFRLEQPLEISNQRLTIRAAQGYKPGIVFRPHLGAGDHYMIRLGSGSSAHLALEGISLRLELPGDVPADGWALVALSTGQSLDLSECVLTVQDGDSPSPIHDQVAMIAVQRRRPGDVMTMADPQLAMGQQARISMERTMARGEASLVSLGDETPLTVRWDQGLLISSKHLIETSGSASEPQFYDQIVLDLDNVTAYCREGLYYLRRGPGKLFQFHVNAYANRCIFITESGAPLFEMVGLAAPPEADDLQSTGEGNRFSPPDMPFLLIRANAGSEPQTFKLGRRWSSETRAQVGVPWLKSPPLDRSAHELNKHDFEVELDPLAGGAGFDPLLVPEAMPAPAAASPSNASHSPAEPAASHALPSP